MKNGEVIKEGTILVAKFAEYAICGRIVIKEKSILKVAFDCPSYRTYVKVFRNKKEEYDENYRIINRINIRIATFDEISMWNKGIYFVESIKNILI